MTSSPISLEDKDTNAQHVLMQIKQREDERLKSYVAQFNMEALLIDEGGEMVLVTSFSSGLKEGEFIFSVLKNDLKTMADMLLKATNYINVEEKRRETM